MSAAYDPAATRERLIARRALAQVNLDSLRKQVANLYVPVTPFAAMVGASSMAGQPGREPPRNP